MDKNTLVKYLKSLGIEVHTSTKARGHQGFFCNNRIDISKNTPEHRVIPTLLHEFAHYVHSKIEPDMVKTGGTFQKLFLSDNPLIESELFKVTNFVDENSLCVRLIEHRERVKLQIKKYDENIKKDYPKFQRSKKFKEFDKFIKKSNAKYLLKYDRVKVTCGFLGLSTKLYTINTIEECFPDMPQAFVSYIRLKSALRKQSRISARINRLNKYYKRPTELFARFVEGLYLVREWIEAIAPYTCAKFFDLLNQGYYADLEDVIPKY